VNITEYGDETFYLGGWPKNLQEIFGMKPIETDSLYPKDRNYVLYHDKKYELRDYATVLELYTAKSEGIYLQDFYANTPAITSHQYQAGKAYFIGARLERQFQTDFYNNLMEELSLKPACPVQHGKGVSVQVRHDNENDYIFVMNFTEEAQSVTFHSTVKDMITGKELIGEVTLEKYEVKIVEKTRTN